MKHFLIVALLTVFSLKPLAAEKISLSSDDLKTYIETQNGRVLSKKEELEAFIHRKGSFGRSFLPTVELSGAQESFKKGTTEQRTQPTYGLEARVNLFNGGRDFLGGKKTELASERARAVKANVLYEQLSRARELYWEASYYREVIGILREAQSLNEKNRKAAQRRISVGVATQTDRVEFEMKEVDLKRELAMVELQYNLRVRELIVLLGFKKNIEIQFTDPYQHDHELEENLKHSHEDHEFLVKGAELLAEERELESTIQKRTSWPRLDAYAAWNQYNQREEDFTEASDRRETVVGLKMTIPFSDIYQSSSEAKAKSAEANAMRHEAEYAKREIDTHIHAELSELKLLHSQVHEAEENIKRAQRYYELTQSEYSRGVKNSPDVLGASEKIFDTKQKYFEIIRNFQISKNHLLSKMGK